MTIRLGRKDLGDFPVAEKQEWLITNGVGGYGSGTVAGSLSRGYHGCLVAALTPPTDRRIMFVKLDETLTYRGQDFELSSNRWSGSSIAPGGFVNIESFTLEGTTPTWRYTLSDAVIEKRIWMEQGKNTVYIAYRVISATAPIEFNARAVTDNRVFHNTGDTDHSLNTTQLDTHSVVVNTARENSLPLTLMMPGAVASPTQDQYNNYELVGEAARGLNSTDSHFHAANFTVTLNQGDEKLFLASAETNPSINNNALAEHQAEEEKLITLWNDHRLKGASTPPVWVEQLVLAANQFVVSRKVSNEDSGKSVIAGYHWFEDWGRDTMISLPGLTLTTGRAEIAKPILQTFSKYVSEGMLPNRFPDGQAEPEYNTIDATFWYFQAIRSYVEATNDDALIQELFPILESIITKHLEGTRYNIKVDPNDGLLSGGEDGVQLTWMDAKVNNVVITPRIGKPVEVNALWYNALLAMVMFAKRIGQDAAQYQTMADKVKVSFSRFWNSDLQRCYDVLDTPNGTHDASLRPNQIFAVALPESPFSDEQQKAIVDSCSQELLTSHGLRSLAQSDSQYKGIYTGDQWHRDSAYHQGTVWGWLIGPYIAAHLRVYKDSDRALQVLSSLADHQSAVGLGSISEIFDGDAPFVPKGCIAQAWSVAEVLRAYELIEQHSVEKTSGNSSTVSTNTSSQIVTAKAPPASKSAKKSRARATKAAKTKTTQQS